VADKKSFKEALDWFKADKEQPGAAGIPDTFFETHIGAATDPSSTPPSASIEGIPPIFQPKEGVALSVLNALTGPKAEPETAFTSPEPSIPLADPARTPPPGPLAPALNPADPLSEQIKLLAPAEPQPMDRSAFKPGPESPLLSEDRQHNPHNEPDMRPAWQRVLDRTLSGGNAPGLLSGTFDHLQDRVDQMTDGKATGALEGIGELLRDYQSSVDERVPLEKTVSAEQIFSGNADPSEILKFVGIHGLDSAPAMAGVLASAAAAGPAGALAAGYGLSRGEVRNAIDERVKALKVDISREDRANLVDAYGTVIAGLDAAGALNILGGGGRKALTKSILTDAILRVAIKGGGEMVTEAAQEGLTEIAAQHAGKQEMLAPENLKQTALAAGTGALVGGPMGATVGAGPAVAEAVSAGKSREEKQRIAARDTKNLEKLGKDIEELGARTFPNDPDRAKARSEEIAKEAVGIIERLGPEALDIIAEHSPAAEKSPEQKPEVLSKQAPETATGGVPDPEVLSEDAPKKESQTEPQSSVAEEPKTDGNLKDLRHERARVILKEMNESGRPGSEVNTLRDEYYDTLSGKYDDQLRESQSEEEIVDLGTPAAPLVAETEEDVEVASKRVNTEPTDAQKEAGNYAKGHVKVQGLDVTIENPKGSKRSGTGPDGTPWETVLSSPYGYIKKTEGADGDHVDVYVGPKLDAETVTIVDQKDEQTGKFDEHKALISFPSEAEALKTYEQAFSDGKGKDRIQSATTIPLDEFKDWLKSGDTKKPFAGTAPASEGDTFIELPDAQEAVPAKSRTESAEDRLVNFLTTSKGNVRTFVKNLSLTDTENKKLLDKYIAMGALRKDNEGRVFRVPKVVRTLKTEPPKKNVTDVPERTATVPTVSPDRASPKAPDARNMGQGRAKKIVTLDSAAPQVIQSQKTAFSEADALAVRDAALGKLKPGQTINTPVTDLGVINTSQGPRRAWARHAVDLAVIDDAGQTLLIKRKFAPGEGKLALPGGLIDGGETALQAAIREAQEETGIISNLGLTSGQVADRVQPLGGARVDRAFDVRNPFWLNQADSSGVGPDDLMMVTTQPHVLRVPLLEKSMITAGDDALDAQIVPLNTVDSAQIGIGDHADILRSAGSKFDLESRPRHQRDGSTALTADDIAAMSDAEFERDVVEDVADNYYVDDPRFQSDGAVPLTETAAFKVWFGDSKVVDENGDPLVVYHGTGAVIDAFDLSRGEFGVHFGTKEAANSIMKVSDWERKGTEPSIYPVYLRIINPIQMSDAMVWSPGTLRHRLIGKGIDLPQWVKDADRETLDFDLTDQAYVAIRDALESAGYDGIVYKNKWEDKGRQSYIAIRPEQIKSATGNRGTFDPSDPRIAYHREESPLTLHDQNQLGFYSKALEAAHGLKQAKGTPEQFLSQMKKAGVKDNEIEATGLREFFQGKKSVTRDEIVAHLEDGAVDLREVTRGRIDRHEFALEQYGKAYDSLPPAQRDMLVMHDLDKTKWSDYSIDPNNPTYRETVLHLPRIERRSDIDALEEKITALQERISRGDGNVDAMVVQLDNLKAERSGINEELGRNTDPNFNSGHFPEPNIIAHIRTSIQKDSEGNSVYVLNELQSDWGQKLRKDGVKDEGKIAELDATIRDLDDDIDRMRAEIGKKYFGNVSEVPPPYGPSAWNDMRRWIQDKTEFIPERLRTAFVEETNTFGRAIQDRILRQAEHETAKSSASGNPLVNTTDQWVNTSLRRFIRQAVEAGADKIAIASGETVHELGMGGQVDGLKYAYNEMYPKKLRAILQKHDKAIKPETIDSLKSHDESHDVGGDGDPDTFGFTVFTLTDKARESVMLGQPLFQRESDRGGSGVSPKAIADAKAAVVEGAKILPESVRVRVARRIESFESGRSYAQLDFLPEVEDTTSHEVKGRRFFHGSKNGFFERYDESKSGVSAIPGGAFPITPDPKVAAKFADELLEVRVTGGNYFDYRRPEHVSKIKARDVDGKVSWSAIEDEGSWFELEGVPSEWLRDAGFDGYWFHERAGEALAVFNQKFVDIRKSRLSNRLARIPREDGAMFQKAATISGRYDPAIGPVERTVWLSLESNNKDWTLNHEGVHALKDIGLFSDEEWGLLEDAARKEGWADQKYNNSTKTVRERYPTLTESKIAEEAIAEAFAKWSTVPTWVKSRAARRMFARIRDFLRGIRNALRSKGYETYEDVFGKIASGEVAARDGSGVGAKIGPGGLSGASEDSRFSREGAVKQTDTPEFKAWFGDSKVVDENGDPLVVYHGTQSDLNVFDDVYRGVSSGDSGWFGEGFYFTDSPELASQYAYAAGDGTEGSNIIPAYVALKNPAVADSASDLQKQLGLDKYAKGSEIKEAALAQKFDGVIIRKGFKSKGFHEVVAFNPTQIKSAIGNRGTFDPSDPRIMYQRDPIDEKRSTRENFRDGYLSVNPDVKRAIHDKSRGFFGRRTNITGNRLQKARITWQDNFLPVRRLQEHIKDKYQTDLEDFMQPYLYEELHHRRIQDRMEDFEEEHIEPFKKALAKSKVGLDDLELYLYAYHAIERNEQIAKINPDMPDGGSGMSSRDALDVLDDFKNKGLSKELFDLGAMVRKIADEKLDMRVSAGLMTQEDVNHLRNTYPFYVPLKGDPGYDLDGAGEPVSLPKGFSVTNKDMVRALGRKSRARDIVSRVAQDYMETIIRAERNRVARSLFDLLQEFPMTDMAVVDKPKMKRFIDKRLGTIEKLPEHMKPKGDKDYKGVVKDMVDPLAFMDPNTMSVMVDGERHMIRFMQPELRDAFMHMNPLKVSGIMKAAYSFNRIRSMLHTSANPAFALTNFFRDFQAAGINLLADGNKKAMRRVMKNAVLSMRAIAAVEGKGAGAMTGGTMGAAVGSLAGGFTGAAIGAGTGAIAGKAATIGQDQTEMARLFKELRAVGGTTGFYSLESWERKAEELRQDIDWMQTGKLHPVKAWREMKKNFMDVVGGFNNVFENATRLAAYKIALEEGLSKEQAASIAKNVSVNFNRRGRIDTGASAFAFASYLFLNPGVQGAHRSLQAYKNAPSARRNMILLTLMSYGATLTTMNIIIGAMLADDEEENLYKGISEWDKSHNWMLLNPLAEREQGVNGRDFLALKAPQPYNYGLVMDSGRLLAEYFMSNFTDLYGEPKTAGELTGEFIVNANGHFNPIGSHPHWMAAFAPEAVTPFVEMGADMKFTSSPIYPKSFDDSKPDHTKSFRTTNKIFKDTAKDINKFFGGDEYHSSDFLGMEMDFSPESFEHLAYWAGGGLGALTLRLYTLGEREYATGEPIRLNDLPIIRRFASGERGFGYSNEFYLIRDEKMKPYDNARRDARKGEDSGKESIEGADLEKEVYPHYKRAEKELKALRKQMKQIEKQKDEGKITPEKHAREEQDIYDERQLAQQRFLVEYHAARRIRNAQADESLSKKERAELIQEIQRGRSQARTNLSSIKSSIRSGTKHGEAPKYDMSRIDRFARKLKHRGGVLAPAAKYLQ